MTDKTVKNHILISGDFHFNLLATDKDSDAFLRMLLELDFVPYLNNVGRPNDTDGKCIDNIFVKTLLSCVKSYTYTNVLTNNYPLFLTIDSTQRMLRMMLDLLLIMIRQRRSTELCSPE